jgi:glucosylceramidase
MIKKKGIGYSIIRTTIHSSDFSSGSYTYIEEGDAALKRSIFLMIKFRIPLIKKKQLRQSRQLYMLVRGVHPLL